jgi:hypothetical protein
MAVDGIGSMLSLGMPTAAKGLGQTDTTDKASDPAAAAKARAEAAAARQKSDLDEVREKGLYAWAQEKKFEALREKIEKELKAAKGIDDKSLAAMSPEDRKATMSSLEAEIAKRIQDVMQQSLTEEAQKAAKEGRPAQPMIIDIAV